MQEGTSVVEVVSEKFDRLRTVMNEKLRRRWAACEAMAMQRGGISAVSEATGMSPNTIRKGMREIEEEYPELVERVSNQRVRRPGGGRHRLTEHDPTLQETLEKLVDPATGVYDVSGGVVPPHEFQGGQSFTIIEPGGGVSEGVQVPQSNCDKV